MLGSLNKQELILLNKAVVELSKTIRDQELTEAAYNFNKGDIVSFTDNNIRRYGVVVRKHPKTLQVKTPELYSINVPPTYLRHEQKPSKNLLEFKKSLLLTKEDFVEIFSKSFNLENIKLNDPNK